MNIAASKEVKQLNVPYWMNLDLVSGYQDSIVSNYRHMLFGIDLAHAWLNLAPKFLAQTINPWSFSLVNLTNEMKGSGPLESNIITEVASYGSQLGTIIDFLELLEKRLDGKSPLNEEEIYRRHKFKHLAADIDKAKHLRVIDL
jgi:hypothetical protein